MYQKYFKCNKSYAPNSQHGYANTNCILDEDTLMLWSSYHCEETFTTSHPYQHWKDESLSQPEKSRVVLNQKVLDLWSCILTNKPLPYKSWVNTTYFPLSLLLRKLHDFPEMGHMGNTKKLIKMGSYAKNRDSPKKGEECKIFCNKKNCFVEYHEKCKFIERKCASVFFQISTRYLLDWICL